MSKKRIFYRANDVRNSYKEGLEVLGNRTVEVEGAYVKRFKNNFFLMSKLSRAERLFLDYLTEAMDDDNYIANNKATRDSFNKFMRGFNLDEYKESTMHKCFSKLCKLEIITKHKGKRGLYQVSPIFFHSDNPDKEREDLIRKKLEEPNMDPINKVRHRLLKNKGSS